MVLSPSEGLPGGNVYLSIDDVPDYYFCVRRFSRKAVKQPINKHIHFYSTSKLGIIEAPSISPVKMTSR